MKRREPTLDGRQVTHRLGVDAQNGRQPKHHNDGRQSCRNLLGELGQKRDDRHGEERQPREHRQTLASQPRAAIVLELVDLASTNDDGQAVDKPKNHRLWNQSHQLAQLQQASEELQHTGQDDRGKDVFRAVGQRQCRQNHSHCARGTADHPWPAAKYACHEPHHKCRIEAGQWAKSSNQREGHSLRNQGHGHREAAENFETVIDRLAEVKKG